MNGLKRHVKRKLNIFGFTLVELIIVIAVLAVLVGLLAPALTNNVENSRATKDSHAMSEVANALIKSTSSFEGYDELEAQVTSSNVSCYVNANSEAGLTPRIIRNNADGTTYYDFSDDARTGLFTAYNAAGRMRGVTVTFEPVIKANGSVYIIKNGIINKYASSRELVRLYQLENVCAQVISTVGTEIEADSQTYRNSEYTVFLLFEPADANNGFAPSSVRGYGQYNGKNLSETETLKTGLLDADRSNGVVPNMPGVDIIEMSPVVKPEPEPEPEPTPPPVIPDPTPEEYSTGKLARSYLGEFITRCFTDGNQIQKILTVTTGQNTRNVQQYEYWADVSSEQNGSVFAWLDGTTCYISNNIKDTRIQPKSTYQLFCYVNSSYYYQIPYIDVTNLDTRGQTTMFQMFYGFGKDVASGDVKIVGLEHLDTSSVTSMKETFRAVGTHTTGSVVLSDVSGWNTSNVTTMYCTFSYIATDTSKPFRINLSKWDLSNTTSISGMFAQTAWHSTEVYIGNLTNWNVAKVTTMSEMFGYFAACVEKFYIGDLSRWSTSNCTSFKKMFMMAGSQASEWSIGDISNWDTSNATTMNAMFHAAGKNVTSFYLGNLGKWNTSKVTDMYYMFKGAGQYASETWYIGDIGRWDVSNVQNFEGFLYCTGMRVSKLRIDLSNWDVGNCTNFRDMFYEMACDAEDWYIGNLDNWDMSKAEDIMHMFYWTATNDPDWSVGDLSKWDVSNCVSMRGVFSHTGWAVTDYYSVGDLSGWDTHNATDISHFFSSAAPYVTKGWFCGDIGQWDTSNVTTLDGLFWCVTLNEDIEVNMNLGNWDTSSVTSMNETFYGAFSRAGKVSLGDLSKWDVSNVTDMTRAFTSFVKLNGVIDPIIDLSGWDTSSVVTHDYCFEETNRSVIQCTFND